MSSCYNNCWCPKCNGILRRNTTCISHVDNLRNYPAERIANTIGDAVEAECLVGISEHEGDSQSDGIDSDSECVHRDGSDEDGDGIGDAGICTEFENDDYRNSDDEDVNSIGVGVDNDDHHGNSDDEDDGIGDHGSGGERGNDGDENAFENNGEGNILDRGNGSNIDEGDGDDGDGGNGDDDDDGDDGYNCRIRDVDINQFFLRTLKNKVTFGWSREETLAQLQSIFELLHDQRIPYSSWIAVMRKLKDMGYQPANNLKVCIGEEIMVSVQTVREGSLTALIIIFWG